MYELLEVLMPFAGILGASKTVENTSLINASCVL